MVINFNNLYRMGTIGECMISRKIIAVICIFLISILFIDGLAIIYFAEHQLSKEMKMGRENHSQKHDKNTDKNIIKSTDGNSDKINYDYIYINDSNYDMNENDSSGYQNNPRSQDEQPVNLLLLGLDMDKTRSDVIILVNYKPWEDTLNLISIPRDTKVIVNGENAKINAMIGMGGEELAISKVQTITGLYIDYYITIDLEVFRKVVDELGGIEIDVPFDMIYDDPEQNLHINLKKGLQILDGNKAEQFVRYRKGNAPLTGYIDGDIGRISAQQAFIKAFIEQKLNVRYLPKLDEISSILSQHTRTNIKLKDLSYYLRSIKDININKINNYILPGDSVVIDDLWYYIFDREKTRQLINEHFYK